MGKSVNNVWDRPARLRILIFEHTIPDAIQPSNRGVATAFVKWPAQDFPRPLRFRSQGCRVGPLHSFRVRSRETGPSFATRTLGLDVPVNFGSSFDPKRKSTPPTVDTLFHVFPSMCLKAEGGISTFITLTAQAHKGSPNSDHFTTRPQRDELLP
jgi:hypothetical protein